MKLKTRIYYNNLRKIRKPPESNGWFLVILITNNQYIIVLILKLLAPHLPQLFEPVVFLKVLLSLSFFL